MSLICGIFSPKQPELASEWHIEKMLKASLHHLTDGHRSFVDDEAGIAIACGHTAAFGLSDQAVNWFQDGAFVAAVAGDVSSPDSDLAENTTTIHNAASLAVAVFQAGSDSFPSNLDGFFSLFLWDRRKRTLHLAADKLARRFLYYYHDPSRALTVFSSELKGVLAHPEVPRQLDEQVLPLYLTKGLTSAPFTLVKGVRKLLPAQRLSITPTTSHSQRYWRPALEEGPDDFDFWRERFRSEIRTAVARVVGAADKVAVNFSGGLDSSLVLAVLKDLGGPPVQAFTLGFRDNLAHPDLEWAQHIAASLGVSHQTVIVDTETEVSPGLMSTLLRQIDEPFESASRLAGEYFLNRASAEAGINSVLTGATPGGAIRRLREHREADPSFDSLSAVEVLDRSFRTPPHNRLDRISRALIKAADMTLVPEVIAANAELLEGLDPNTAFMTERRLTASNTRDSLFTQFTPSLLGVEERTPFLDTRLAVLSVSIPPVFWGYASKEQERAPLKDAYRHYLGLDPDRRPKGAFPSTPRPAWLTAMLVPSLQNLVTEGVVRPEYLAWLKKGVGQGRKRVEDEAWRWFVLNCWYRFQLKGEDPFANV